jgi:peptidoglycan hydrolase-like protein with peptidoglycan-binding domain
MSDVAGGIVVGLLGTAVGVVAVDYAFSEPGNSWVSKLSSSLLPSDKHLALSPASTPTPSHARLHPSSGSGSGRIASVAPPVSRPSSMPSTRPAPSASHAPLTVTPDLVNRVATALNQQLQTKLPANGLITEDMKHALASLQQQLGISPTGFPDPKTLSALGVQLHPHDFGHVAQAAARSVAKATPVADVGNFISKTFGGPPSTRMTGPDEGVRKTQHLLNTFFGHKVVDEDGLMGSTLGSFTKKFQEMQGLKATGVLDSKTQTLINNLDFSSTAKARTGSYSIVGAAGAGGTGSSSGSSGVATWTSETQSLGVAAQNIIRHAMSEGKAQRLASLSKLLKAAGFPVTATAVATSHGGATVASGWW